MAMRSRRLEGVRPKDNRRSPGGRWIHLEISPTLAHDAALMDAAITKALGA